MIQIIRTFLDSAWGKFSVISAGIAMIWAFAKAVGAFKTWICKKIRQRKQRRQFPKKTLEIVVKIKEANEQDMRKLNQRFNMIEKDIIQLKADMRTNNDQTATVMLEKMMWSYHYYVLNKNKIPLDVQTALVQMAKQYRTSQWHNHIPSDFQKKIIECEIE